MPDIPRRNVLKPSLRGQLDGHSFTGNDISCGCVFLYERVQWTLLNGLTRDYFNMEKRAMVSAHALGGVSGVASFITTDEQLQ